MIASFRMVLACSIVASCLVGFPAAAATTWRKVSDREFPGWQAELQRIGNGADARVSHVCVIVRGDTGRKGEAVLLAYFRERHYIQGFGRPAPPYPLDDTAMAGFDAIDLGRDVVASPSQIRGSTSRVTKAYVDDIIDHCRSLGTQIIITKKGR